MLANRLKVKFKKEFAAQAIGQEAFRCLNNTSLFGNEIPENGTGIPIVGPEEYIRKWYAQVDIKDGIITAVK